MLIDEDNGDVLSLLCEGLEGALNLRSLGLSVDNQEIALCVRGVGNML